MTGSDARKLTDALLGAGFTKEGERTGSYVTLDWPAGSGMRPVLLVPLNDEMPDFPELMRAVLIELDSAIALGQMVWRRLFLASLVDLLEEARRGAPR